MKKILPLLLAAVLLLSLTACGKKSAYLYIITIRMGAEVELCADDGSNVAAITAKNKEASSLCPDTSFVGMPITEALTVLTRAAVEAGYLTDGQTIALSLLDTGKGDPDVESILSDIADAVSRVLTEANITVDLDLSNSTGSSSGSSGGGSGYQHTVTPVEDDTPQENDAPAQENTDPADTSLPLGEYYSYTCNGASGAVYLAEYRGDGSFAFTVRGCYTPEELMNQEPWAYETVEEIYNDPTLSWMELDGVNYLLWSGNADIVTAEYDYDPATGCMTVLGGFTGWDEFVGRTFMPV